MSSLQEAFDQGGAQFILPPGEHEGPLRIDRPCTVEGRDATLWAAHGPVLEICAPQVSIRGLRVEVTEPGDQTAIRTDQADTVFEEVEVRGDTAGIPGEAGHWDLPPLVSLGVFAAEEQNSFALRITAPGTAALSCGIGGVRVSPRLEAGEQTVVFETDGLRDNTILYGELVVRTKVLRRLSVTGRARKDAPVRREAPSLPVRTVGSSVPAPEARLAPAVSGVPYMKRGQRIALRELDARGVLKAALEHQGFRRAMELDCYIFLLQKDQKVRGDRDLVFFRNTSSRNGAVRLSEGGEIALADLDTVEPSVERLAVCWSIYGNEPERNFSQVREPVLRLFAGEREICRLKLEHLSIEKTLVAVEVYRYKGEWKLNFVGAGYQDGLRRLCESYGVEVE